MSLLTIALCLVQMTALLLLAGVAARLLRPLAPAQAAKVGAAGLLLSLSLVVISLTGVPKPFVTSLTASSHSHSQTKTSESSATLASQSDSDAIVEPADLKSNSPQIQMSLQDLVQLLDSTLVEQASDQAAVLQPFNLCLVLLVIAAIVPTLFGLGATVQLHRRSTPIAGARKRRLFKFVRQDFGRSVHFRASRYTSAPCVTFVGGRTIYLPFDWCDWNDSELSASIAHEVEHLSRHDPLVRLLTQLAASVQRFHPLATWLHQSVILSQEMAADQQAADQRHANHSNTHQVAAQNGRLDYAATLSRIALRLDTRTQSGRSRMVDWILGAGTLSVSSSQLIRRIEMLTRNPSHTSGLRRHLIGSAAMLSVVSAAMLSASWSVRAEPPAVSPRLDTPAEDSQSSDAPRIARLVENERPASQIELRPASQPWEDLGGNDAGYAVVHVDALLSKVTLLQQLVTGAVESQLDPLWQAIVTQESADARQSTGLSISNLKTVAAGVNFNVVNTPPKDEQDDKSTVTMGASNGRIWFKQPVAHDPIANALDVDKIAKLIADGGATLDQLNGKSYEEFTQVMIDGMFTSGDTTDSLGFSPEEEAVDYDVAQLEKLKLAWQQVDGGEVAVCFSLPEKLGYLKDRDDELAEAVLQHTACLGIGLDFNGTQFVNARFSMIPREGISDADFQAHLDSIETRIAEQIELEMEDSENEFLARLAKRVFDSRTVRVASAGDREPAIAGVVEVRLPMEWLALLLM